MARKLREFKTVYKRYSERSTPLLHKGVVESTAPAQQAPSKGCFYLFAAGSESLPPGHEPFRGGAWLGESSGALFLTG